MKKYQKLIILSSILLVLIALITLAMIFDVNVGLFKNLSISGIKAKGEFVDNLLLQEALETANNTIAKTTLADAKNDFDVAKEKYENIDPSTIEIVQEATKEENYFIEYLWIVLGNYATANNVAIDIITPGSNHVIEVETSDEDEETEDDKDDKNNKGDNTTTNSQNTSNTVTALDDGIKIIVEGRYANLADFVFDVENDKSLRFRLDNIKMSYTKDNAVQATFDVLSLSVVK